MWYNAGMQFEWDYEKSQKNKEKHRIGFEDAVYVFKDPYRIEIYDDEHSTDEERIKVIGKVAQVLVVIYTERKEVIRIISARYAEKREREAYYGYGKV